MPATSLTSSIRSSNPQQLTRLFASLKLTTPKTRGPRSQRYLVPVQARAVCFTTPKVTNSKSHQNVKDILSLAAPAESTPGSAFANTIHHKDDGNISTSQQWCSRWQLLRTKCMLACESLVLLFKLIREGICRRSRSCCSTSEDHGTARQSSPGLHCAIRGSPHGKPGIMSNLPAF